jgi:hypothetical protein
MSDHEEHASISDAPPQPPPPAEDEPRPFDDGDDSQLSDLDDEIFADYNEAGIGGKGEDQEQVPIDEDTVTTLGKYKKKGGVKAGGGDAATSKGGKRRRRDKSARHEEEEDVEQPVYEKPLTEEESKFPSSSPTFYNGSADELPIQSVDRIWIVRWTRH